MKDAFSYYSYAGQKILNQHIFKSKFISSENESTNGNETKLVEENENILRYKNDVDIVDELFSLYDIENVLYESKNLFNNKNILPDGLYYINEYIIPWLRGPIHYLMYFQKFWKI